MSVDRIWNLVETLESCCPARGKLEKHAMLCGTLEAAGHLMDPGMYTLARALEQGLDNFLLWWDDETGRELRPFYRTGFASLIVCAGVPLGRENRSCATCASFDAELGCMNGVSFLDRTSGEYFAPRPDDCCSDHEPRGADDQH